MSHSYFRCAANSLSMGCFYSFKEDAINRAYFRYQQQLSSKAVSTSNTPIDEIDIERYFYYLTYP